MVYEVPSEIGGVPGTPCICFTTLDHATPASINFIRMKVWNHGRVPTLWIVSPQGIRIYDSFARPQVNDETNSSNHLLDELRQIGGQLHGIDDYHKSKFDTGEFWQSGKGRDIEPRQRVDTALLSDLLQTRRALEYEDLNADIAQALLGRAIFVKYLEDRQILRPSHFERFGSKHGFREVLEDTSRTYAFFAWLRSKLNGDLFPITKNETDAVIGTHLEILRQFLSGDDMSRYPITQARLWPYSFETIPIELVSSIYEMFAHETDREEAESTSIHYTRFNLVELMLSLAMQGMHHTATILDPACGSGVFLVEAFRRVARLKAQHYGRALNRIELRQLLTSQIFGIDIDHQAVYVAAFSLYLALLELDPDPQPLDALRLPKLLDSGQSDDFSKNLYVDDFFNPKADFNHRKPFTDRDFDLIVGNPPWTALTKTEATEPDVHAGPDWGIEYCQIHDIAHNKPDQAFAWRARDFSRIDTRISFVLGSRLLYQGSIKGKRWRRKFLETNEIIQLVNLSDFRKDHLLFGRGSSTSQPASVVTFCPRLPNPRSSILHIAPEWYPGVRQRDEVVIYSSDVQHIPQELVRQYDFLWKTAFRGTPRDFRLLARLHSFPTLEEVLGQAHVRKRFDRSYGVTFGKQPTKDASALQGLPYLSAGTTRRSSAAVDRYSVDVQSLPRFTEPRIAKKSISRPLRLPALVLRRGLRDNRPCAALVESDAGHDNMVLHRYYGISLDRADRRLGYRLNAILNSEIAAYMAFFFSSSLGWEREVVEPQDWMQLRLPHTILDHDLTSDWAAILEGERWLRKHWRDYSNEANRSKILRVKQDLDNRIADLYEISRQEHLLIADTLRYTITPFLRGNKHRSNAVFTKSTPQQLQDYALRLCEQLDAILAQAGLQLNATIIPGVQGGLSACRFAWDSGGETRKITTLNSTDLHVVLDQMSADLRAMVAERLYVQQDLRVYDDHAFWVIKSSQARMWTETSALHDADTVVREHMNSTSYE